MTPPERASGNATTVLTDRGTGVGPDGLKIRQLGMDRIELIKQLNADIFGEERIINSFEKDDVLMLVAFLGDRPVGFKLGYRENRYTFYSAKGGVVKDQRRAGVARALLEEMSDVARSWGYTRLAFDTFPNRHPGMTIMGLVEGFQVTDAGFNRAYRDFRVRFEKRL